MTNRRTDFGEPGPAAPVRKIHARPTPGMFCDVFNFDLTQLRDIDDDPDLTPGYWDGQAKAGLVQGNVPLAWTGHI